MIKRFTGEGRHECGLDALVAGKLWAFVAVTGEGRAAALGCEFHAIAGTNSTARWARIPREGGHGFHGIMGAL